jgi:DNA ligase-1
MEFSTFAEYLQKLEEISSRLEITALLAELLSKLEADEVQQACYLLQGQLLPPYENIEFQIAVKTVIKALARLLPTEVLNETSLFSEPDFSAAEAEVTTLYHQLGDLGKVAESIVIKNEAIQKNAQLQKDTITQVYAHLAKIANDNGAQSQQRKLEALTALLQQLDARSAKFVVRIILGRLRLGFSDMTIIDALSWVMTGNKSEHEILELAYQKKTDIGKLAALYLQEKDPKKRYTDLENYTVEVGVPVMPALCQRLNSAAEMIEKMGEVIAEPKYDGLRVQIHYKKNNDKDFIRTFTRNLEETSEMFPELQQAVKTLNCESCILDAEAIGYDLESGELLPFQQTTQRRRKHNVAEKAKSIPIRFYIFDILALNGEDLLHLPLSERKQKLAKLFTDNAILYHSPELHTSDAQVLHDFHEQNLAAGLEGVVVKQKNAPYQSGRKGWSWVKMKEAEGTSGKLADTLDVIVMGYYFGRGKRTAFGIGAILVGVYNQSTNAIVTIAKIGTGLSDEQLRQTKEKCDKLKTTKAPAQYQLSKFLYPDVWCLPGFVVEVAADELTRSPVHSAQWALRFPRLVQFREDKTWDQATSLKEVQQLAELSAHVAQE